MLKKMIRSALIVHWTNGYVYFVLGQNYPLIIYNQILIL